MNPFFDYTSGRWIHDKNRGLSRRYRQFNVHALQKVAADACGANIVGIQKSAEGAHRFLFLLLIMARMSLLAFQPDSQAPVLSPLAKLPLQITRVPGSAYQFHILA